MDYDEAIRIKEATGDEFIKIDPDQIEEADKLSIEALKLARDLIALADASVLARLDRLAQFYLSQ